MTEKSKRPALGRGLKALLPQKEAEAPAPAPLKVPSIPADEEITKVETGELLHVNINIVRPTPTQPRRALDEDKLNELAESIREKGLLNPIIVRRTEDGIYWIIAGERRWRACGIAGLTRVPVIVKEADELEAFELALIENIQREDLSPLEEAESYRHLLVTGSLSQEEVAKRVGKNRSTVANSLRLLLLPTEVKDLMDAHSITAGHARAILALENETRMIEAARKVASAQMSVRATEKLVKKLSSAPATRKKKDKATQFREIEDNLRKNLGTRVKLQPKTKTKGTITIDYYTLDQLDQLIRLLSGEANDGNSDSER